MVERAWIPRTVLLKQRIEDEQAKITEKTKPPEQPDNWLKSWWQRTGGEFISQIKENPAEFAEKSLLFPSLSDINIKEPPWSSQNIGATLPYALQFAMPQTPKGGKVPKVGKKIPEKGITVAKEPWQMTRKEYANYIEGFRKQLPTGIEGEQARANFNNLYSVTHHGAYVESALAKGKPVPPEVLKDYPDLVKTTPKIETPEISIGKMAPESADDIIKNFGKAITSEGSREAWDITRNLRKVERAKRFNNFSSELQKLIDEGVNVDTAIERAKGTLKGKLPVETTNIMNSTEIREALYTKLHEVLKASPSEELATKIALDNALKGLAIPRTAGIKGGSAYSRLVKVFGKDIVDVIEKPGKFTEKLLDEPFIPVDNELLDFYSKLPEVGKQISMIPITKRVKVLSALQRAGLNIVDALGIPKALKFSLDMSYMFRQLGLSGARHPVSWIKTWKPYAKAMRSEKVALELDNVIRTDPANMNAIQKLGLDLYELKQGATYMERPETMASKIAEKHIPGVRMSNRGAAVAVNYFVTDVGKQAVKILDKMKAAPEEYKAMGSLFNELVGRGEMPKVLRGTAGDILNKLLSSPRYVISRFEFPTKLFSPSRAVRQEAASTLVAWAGLNAAILGMAKLMGAEMELDPRSADAYKIKIGGKRIDVWVGYAQIIRLLAQLTTGQRKTQTGEIVSIPRSQVLGRFLQSKESPGVGALVTLMSGKNYVGEDLDLTTVGGIVRYGKESFAPAAFEEIYDAYVTEGVPSALLSATGTLGVGVSTYESKGTGGVDILEGLKRKKSKSRSSFSGGFGGNFGSNFK